MRSENLEMYSETTSVRSQETLRAFEQIHAFLVKSVGTHDAVLGTTCIVAFKAEEDFAHFRPKADSISFLVPGADRDYVILGLPEANAFEPGARAYAGRLSRQLGLKPPAWLDDGLNTLFATFAARGSEVIAGELTPARRRALLAESWGSLDQILISGANNRSLSNQRFALVHMLVLSTDYAGKFKDLLAELQTGNSSQAALEKVYAKPLSTLEKDLKAYVAGPSFTGVPISSRSEALTISPAEPASPFDVNLALAGVVNQPGRESDGQAWLDRLAGMNPERPEPWVGLGYIALHRDQTLVAAQDFEKAISLGSRDPGVLWTRSRIALAESTKDTEENVRAQLDKEPARVDLRVKLAALALDQRRPGLAYRLLEPVKDVPADLTPRYLAELAYAQLETGEQSAAKLTVARLEDRSDSPADKAEASRLKNFLAGPTRLTLGSNAAAPAAGEQEKLAAQKAAAEASAIEARNDAARNAEARNAEARNKEIADAGEKAAADAREKADARAKEKADAEQRQQAVVEARVKAELDAKEKAAAEVQEKKEARAREKADREAQTKAIADARQRAASEARDKALAEAAEKQEAKAREKAAAEARAQAAEEYRQKNLAEAREKAAAAAREKVEAREKAAADAREQLEARARAQAEADARAKAAEEARQKPEPTVLAQAAKETRATAEAYSATAQPQQASNISNNPAHNGRRSSVAETCEGAAPPCALAPESGAAAPAPTFPAMLTGSFVELGCGDQIKVVVQTEQGRKNFRIKNPANVIVSSKGGGTVDLNCGPQKPTNVRIQFGPGEGGFDGLVEAIYFE